MLAQQAQESDGLRGPAAAANLRAVQALVEAQQAAMIACITAATVASTASH